MKFRSPTAIDVHVALTSGHTVLVTPEGVELPEMFHREAIARGCLPETMADPTGDALGNLGFQRAKVIGEAMEKMVTDAIGDDFTSTGAPDLRKLNARCGFTVSRDEADAIWAEVARDHQAP